MYFEKWSRVSVHRIVSALALALTLCLLMSEPWAQSSVDLRQLEAEEKSRLKSAREYLEKNPGTIRPETQKAILSQRVVLGMCPFEAHLAAGQFYYGMKNDPKWPSGTNPIRIMWAQCKEPDSSEFWMSFMTRTQFEDRRPTVFKVIFKEGRAVAIERGKTAE